MGTDSDQHSSDHEQLQSTLELYPSITLSQVEGDPPDNYEIEYHLKGYVRNPDGTIAVANLHRVRITLPFGYPHFAPTVKPLTHIFHPDIDPAAIRIADQWQAKPNLSDLVLTIGEMICGNIYSSDNPFNQEAADWYDQHQADLPLDILQIADIDDSDERFDTLDDDTFSSLGLDDDLFDSEPVEDESRIDLVLLQLEQNNIFAANKILSEIPESTNIPDRENIEETIAAALKKSDKLFKQAEQLEDQGLLDDAAEIINEIESIATDTPGLENLRNRILQSQSLADSFSLQPEEKKKEPPLVQEKSTAPLPPAKDKVLKPKVSAGPSIPVKPILTAILICIVLVVGGMLYLQDRKVLTQGRNDLQKVHSLMTNNQFDDALMEGEAVLRDLKNIKLLNSAEESLAAEINTLLNSDDFQQGLLGNTLYDGVYVPVAKAERLKELGTLTDSAEQFVKQGRIRNALIAYQEALAYASKHDLTESGQQLAQTVNNLRFEDALITAEKAEREEEWENAADTYRRAIELSRTLSDSTEAEELTKRLTAATFRLKLDQSKQTFTGAQWQETITVLEHAQQLIRENPAVVSLEEKEELELLLLNSRLYQMLTLAREAYEQRDLIGSIKQYQAALRFLDSEKAGFGTGIEESYAKIEKTLLMMRIAHEQSNIVRAKNKKHLENIAKHYKQILDLIQSSKFNRDENLQKLNKNIKEQLVEIRKELELEEMTKYLRKNYQEIFTKNYPSFAGSKLEHPKVRFIKKIGHKMLFTISCVERSQGSSSRLELKYLYDPTTDIGSLYTGQ